MSSTLELLDRDLLEVTDEWVSRRRAEQRSDRRRRAITPIPDCGIEFMERYCFWPHIETGLPVASVNPMQRDYMDRRSAFRWNPETGERVSGADVIGKARRVRSSSMVLALITHAILHFHQRHGVSLRALGVIHTEKRQITDALFAQINYMLERLPADWRDGKPASAMRVGHSIRFPGGGVLEIATAGVSESVSSRVGRSGKIDILWLSETAFFAHASALFAAAEECVPANSGWVVSESTLPADREAWHAAQLLMALGLEEGQSKFLQGHFWPWYIDREVKRISAGSPRHEYLMSEEFTASLPKEVLSAESRLREEQGLDGEMIAYRRRMWTGTPKDRLESKRENPERLEDCFESGAEPWLDAGALERMDQLYETPSLVHKSSARLATSVWEESIRPDTYVVVGVDVAEAYGRDFKAAIFIDVRNGGDQIAEIHGRSLDSQFAEEIVEVLERLVDFQRGRYVVAVESNRGRNLIAELQMREVNQFSERYHNRRTNKPSSRLGVWSQGASYRAITQAIATAVEGPDVDEHGAPRERGPICAIRSAALGTELRNLVVRDNLVRAEKGHDDYARAFGIAHYAANQVRVPSPNRWGTGAPPGGAPDGRDRSGGMG